MFRKDKKRSFWDSVKKVIRLADVLLLLLDARFVDESRNIEIEDKVRLARKPLIYVVTKSDMVGKRKAESQKGKMSPCVFISAKDHTGRAKLKERIIIEAERRFGKKARINIGVLGYPNVGKSSLINYMKGQHSARTSSLSGYTKFAQVIKSDNRLYFIDTPGVIPYMEKDAVKHVSMSVIDSTKVHDPDLMVAELMRRHPGKIEAYFGVAVHEDKQKTIEEIALQKHMLLRGGVPDVERMCRLIIKNFQSGKIKI
ncbi:MAG: 50S ribosome-binding GTPase [Candidatus Aenigmarchaeota archaeon]|nr:50S ribosome-binding GTPase [Candidatus Aenigmarchaeota archaeon]